MVCCCSNTFQTVQDIGKKTWSFYRYRLTKEYHDKPSLAPPLIIVNHLWRILVYVYRRCGYKWTTEDNFKTSKFFIQRQCVYVEFWTKNYCKHVTLRQVNELDNNISCLLLTPTTVA